MTAVKTSINTTGFNGAFSEVFERRELKYLVSENVIPLLIPRLREHMCDDAHGVYTVSNIYFDTQDFDLIRRSLEKPVYKEKLRLRSYSVPDSDNSIVFLELKKKYKDTVYKRRVPMTLWDAKDYLLYGHNPHDDGQIMRELKWSVDYYGLTPKVYIAYDRIALTGTDDPALRITFDNNIRYRANDLLLTAGTDGCQIDSGGYVMEIKVQNAMPLWLARLLSELRIFSTSFSKYGECYRAMCGKNL